MKQEQSVNLWNSLYPEDAKAVSAMNKEVEDFAMWQGLRDLLKRKGITLIKSKTMTEENLQEFTEKLETMTIQDLKEDFVFEVINPREMPNSAISVWKEATPEDPRTIFLTEDGMIIRYIGKVSDFQWKEADPSTFSRITPDTNLHMP